MKRKYIVFITLVIMFVVFLIGYIFVYTNQQKVVLKKDVFVFEFGSDIPSDVSYYIKDADSIKNITDYKLKFPNSINKENKVISDNSELFEVGEYIFNLQNKKKNIKFTIKVIDTISPEFKKVTEEIIIENNKKEINFVDYFEAEDLSEFSIKIEGEYNIQKVGDYNLKVIAIDKYNNKNQKDFILKVIESKKNKSNPTNSNEITLKKNENIKPSNQEQNFTQNSSEEKIKEEFISKYRKDISDVYVKQVNEYRVANGLPALPVTDEAQRESDRRAKELVDNYSHTGVGAFFGENIGHGSVGVDFYIAWRNSPPHNATMLREQAVAIASSVYEHNNHWYAVLSVKMEY